MGHVHRFDRAPRGLAASTALGLSTLFAAVYGGTAWVTSLRTDVGRWVFAWERNMPLVPWLIVPYMSLDIFFVAAPLLIADRVNLRAFTRRMTAVILIAGAGFLAMPLQFGFARPQPAGWTGPIFALLHGFDRPYNLFPSLHIAILVILAGTYDRHTRGVVRWLIRVWFTLIGASTMLTWQHHAIDVAGGLALALVCAYAIPAHRAQQAVTANPRIGAAYAAAAAIAGGLGMSARPWSLLLLWPAVSMSIAAGAYFGMYSAFTRKYDGRLAPAARIILAPWLAGQQLSLMYYRPQSAPWDEIAPGVWMGRRLDAREAAAEIDRGVTAVLDLTCELSEAKELRSLPYLNVQVLDLTAPTPPQVRAAIEFVNAHRRSGPVYVHCKIGYSRSAVVVGSWLIDAGLASDADDAAARMLASRPGLVIRPEAWAALRAFSRAGDRIQGSATPHLIEART